MTIELPPDLSRLLMQYAKDCAIPPNQAACEVLRAFFLQPVKDKLP